MGYRPSLALLFHSDIETKTLGVRSSTVTCHNYVFLAGKLSQCHVKSSVCRAPSWISEELLLSSTPSPRCCKLFCQTSQGCAGLAARERRGRAQDLLSRGGSRHAAASPLPSPATLATLCHGEAWQLPWALSEAPALKSPSAAVEYDGPNPQELNH